MPPRPAPPPEPPGLSPRRAALDILTLVRGGASLDEALERCRSFAALEGPDRGLARLLATAVLRRQGALDAAIAPYLDTPLPKRAAKAMDVLRLAAAQSALLGAPDHAAVSTAVALAKSFQETAGYAGLVNAVARKLARTAPAAVAAAPVRVDTPGWMWRAWDRAWGPATARAMAEIHRAEPPLDLTAKDPSAAAALAERLGAELLPTGSLRMAPGADLTGLPGFAEGEFWVQDAAAALPARLFGDVRGRRVLDLCAAPGGKTMQLAAAGARVAAVDVSGHRLKRVAENLARTGLSAETIKADILDWTPAEKADAILLDAPCTATGVIRRHPDILRIRTEDDLAGRVRLQAKLIERALSFLKEGGVLVYAVCSLQPEEGERQIAAALGRHPRLRPEPVGRDEIEGLSEAVTTDGFLRTLPSFWAARGGMDGFFAARLRLEGAG